MFSFASVNMLRSTQPQLVYLGSLTLSASVWAVFTLTGIASALTIVTSDWGRGTEQRVRLLGEAF